MSVAAPLLLSRDVYTYAAYGRIDSLYHHNPYVTRLSSFPHDPFVAVTPGQWVHTHSHYGPLFTLASARISRAWAGSANTTILAFKLLAGLSIAVATGLVALTAARARLHRAPLAAALLIVVLLWSAPLLGLFADEVLLLAGALVTVVLALTLIPADPFHGRTTPAVMDGVHYGAASALLVVLAVVISRVRTAGRREQLRLSLIQQAMSD